MNKIAILDFETTGIDARTGQIIEGAAVLVEMTPEQTLGGELETYTSFNDPGSPIPAEIVKLTGLTDEIVRGHTLNWSTLGTLLSKADLLIAHNARFDRAWLEIHGKLRTPKWGCTLAMIDWKGRHGMPCATLKHLAWEHDFFPNAHRALDDVKTLIHLLKQPTKANPAQSYFQELVETFNSGKRLVLAKGSPFDKKDLLKSRDFHWAPGLKTWWKLAKESDWGELKTWLDTEIYQGRPTYETIPQADYLAPDFRAQHRLE